MCIITLSPRGGTETNEMANATMTRRINKLVNLLNQDRMFTQYAQNEPDFDSFQEDVRNAWFNYATVAFPHQSTVHTSQVDRRIGARKLAECGVTVTIDNQIYF